MSPEETKKLTLKRQNIVFDQYPYSLSHIKTEKKKYPEEKFYIGIYSMKCSHMNEFTLRAIFSANRLKISGLKKAKCFTVIE